MSRRFDVRGDGLLGEAPALENIYQGEFNTGIKRVLGSGGSGVGGLLGRVPTDSRMMHHDRMMQQNRSSLDQPSVGGAMRERSNMGGVLYEQPSMSRDMRDRSNIGDGLLEHPDMRERQTYSGTIQDDSYAREEGYGDYQETNVYAQEWNVKDDYYEEPDRGRIGLLESLDQRGGLMHERQEVNYDQTWGSSSQPNIRQHIRGLLDEPVDQVGLIEQQRGGSLDQAVQWQGQSQHERWGKSDPLVQTGLMDAPVQRRPVDRPNRLADIMKKAELQVRKDQSRQRGVLGRPDRRAEMMEQAELQMSRDLGRGLLDRPDRHAEMMEKAELQMSRDQSLGRGLLDRPTRQSNMMEQAEIQMSRDLGRGLLDRPTRPSDMMEQAEIQMSRDQSLGRGLLDRPTRQEEMMEQAELQMRMNVPLQRSLLGRPNRQPDIIEKAELQMRLLEEEKRRELEDMQLLQHQQQALKIQQQQDMQHLKQHQLGILGSGPGLAGKGGEIPSLFDLPAQRKLALGKRPGSPKRFSDNKRSRLREDNKRPRPAQPEQGNRSQQQAPRRPALSGQRVQNRRNTSPESKTRDTRKSGSERRSSSRHETSSSSDGKDRKSKAGENKESSQSKTKTEVTITMGDEYDPAEPTVDPMDKVFGEKGKEEIVKNEKPVKEELGNTVVKVDNTEKDGEKQDDKQKPMEISMTVTVDKKGRSVNDADKKPDVKSPEKSTGNYKCNVCDVKCFDELSFNRHMNGVKHRRIMDAVMETTMKQTHIIKARLQAEEHLRQVEGSTKGLASKSETGKKSVESHCKVCNKKYTGAYKDHKDEKEHKAREDRSKAGCKLCKVSTFNTYLDFTKHLQSTWHKKNKKLNKGKDDSEVDELVTLDIVGFEEDTNQSESERRQEHQKRRAANSEPITTTPKVAAQPLNEMSSTSVRAIEELPGDYNPNVAVGLMYIVPVSGFFCKLCHKFYNNEATAKGSHCQSESHFERYMKAASAKALNKFAKDSMPVKQSSTLNETKGQVASNAISKDASCYETANEGSTVNAGDDSHVSLNGTLSGKGMELTADGDPNGKENNEENLTENEEIVTSETITEEEQRGKKVASIRVQKARRGRK